VRDKQTHRQQSDFISLLTKIRVGVISRETTSLDTQTDAQTDSKVIP
jgi:hypothetical protein